MFARRTHVTAVLAAALALLFTTACATAPKTRARIAVLGDVPMGASPATLTDPLRTALVSMLSTPTSAAGANGSVATASAGSRKTAAVMLMGSLTDAEERLDGVTRHARAVAEFRPHFASMDTKFDAVLTPDDVAVAADSDARKAVATALEDVSGVHPQRLSHGGNVQNIGAAFCVVRLDAPSSVPDSQRPQFVEAQAAWLNSTLASVTEQLRTCVVFTYDSVVGNATAELSILERVLADNAASIAAVVSTRAPHAAESRFLSKTYNVSGTGSGACLTFVSLTTDVERRPDMPRQAAAGCAAAPYTVITLLRDSVRFLDANFSAIVSSDTCEVTPRKLKPLRRPSCDAALGRDVIALNTNANDAAATTTEAAAAVAATSSPATTEPAEASTAPSTMAGAPASTTGAAEEEHSTKPAETTAGAASSMPPATPAPHHTTHDPDDPDDRTTTAAAKKRTSAAASAVSGDDAEHTAKASERPASAAPDSHDNNSVAAALRQGAANSLSREPTTAPATSEHHDEVTARPAAAATPRAESEGHRSSGDAPTSEPAATAKLGDDELASTAAGSSSVAPRTTGVARTNTTDASPAEESETTARAARRTPSPAPTEAADAADAPTTKAAAAPDESPETTRAPRRVRTTAAADAEDSPREQSTKKAGLTTEAAATEESDTPKPKPPKRTKAPRTSLDDGETTEAPADASGTPKPSKRTKAPRPADEASETTEAAGAADATGTPKPPKRTKAPRTTASDEDAPATQRTEKADAATAEAAAEGSGTPKPPPKRSKAPRTTVAASEETADATTTEAPPATTTEAPEETSTTAAPKPTEGPAPAEDAGTQFVNLLNILFVTAIVVPSLALCAKVGSMFGVSTQRLKDAVGDGKFAPVLRALIDVGGLFVSCASVLFVVGAFVVSKLRARHEGGAAVAAATEHGGQVPTAITHGNEGSDHDDAEHDERSPMRPRVVQLRPTAGARPLAKSGNAGRVKRPGLQQASQSVERERHDTGSNAGAMSRSQDTTGSAAAAAATTTLAAAAATRSSAAAVAAQDGWGASDSDGGSGQRRTGGSGSDGWASDW